MSCGGGGPPTFDEPVYLVAYRMLAYWRRQLADIPPILELPLDHSRPPAQIFRAAFQSRTTSKPLLEALKTQSREEGLSLFVLLLSAFYTLLHRYTRQEDIVIGLPIAARSGAGGERLFGFTNTLALRTHLSGSPTFLQLAQRVSDVVLEAYTHQGVPFETLLEELQVERNLSHSPVFQVLFILKYAPPEVTNRQSLPPGLPDVCGATPKCDLMITVTDKEEGLNLCIEYNAELFGRAKIRRMLKHLTVLLEGVAADPEQKIAALPLLSKAERRLLLFDWNDTARHSPKEECIHELFEKKVELTPDDVAVVDKDRQLTYRELNALANQVAHHLQAAGVRAEVRVGIHLERSINMMVAVLGILKAGGVCVPMEPTYPKERLAFMSDDAQALVILTQRQLADSLPESDAHIICLESEWDCINRESEDNPCAKIAPDNLAYILYTSGSTGRPKGVLIHHRDAVNQITWDPFEAEEIDTDKSLYKFPWFRGMCPFQSLLRGTPSLVIPNEVLNDVPRLLRVLAENHVRLIVLVPSLLQIILDTDFDLHFLLPELKYCFVTAEAASIELCQRFSERMPGRLLINFYGTTEAAGTWYDVQRSQLLKSVPIGRPISNTQIYLLDSNLQPVPIGVIGELHLSGAGVSRGYNNQPRLTAEKFIPNPFSREPGARMYKTGDLARYLSDGNIEYVGRIDNQVKIRGFRVELEEIESVLNQHPAVRQSAVTTHHHCVGGQRSVAYFVPTEARSPTINELRAFLDEKLPAFMVPSAFVRLDALPLTPNGKVNRHALPAPDQARPEVAENLVFPRDECEIQLAKIWEAVLGIKPVGIRDNFFELGGNSLIALRLFAQIEKLFGRNLPLAILFQAPTIELLADILRQQGWVPSEASLVAIQPGGSKPPFFCIHASGGHVLCYRDLALHLGSEQPFYGLQAQGLDGKQPRHTRVEDMAAHYIEEIRTIQPEGPYYLGGSSFGGKVAYEMARQLNARGRRVALVALFDTYGLSYPKLLPNTTQLHYKIYRFMRRVEQHFDSLLMFDSTDKKLAYFIEKANRARKLLKEGYKNWCKAIARQLCQAVEYPVPNALQETHDTIYLAGRSYVPQVYEGRVTLFRASKQPLGIYPDTTLGWGGLVTGGLDIHEVPGHHGAIVVEPRVRFLADKLRDCLNNAQSNFYTDTTCSSGREIDGPKCNNRIGRRA